MRKIADYMATFPDQDPLQWQYRVRVYADEGAPPVVVATDTLPGEPHLERLSNAAPRLAALAAGKDLRSYDSLRWVTHYKAPDSAQELFESSLFAVIGDGQVAYREAPRPGEQPPREPQAALLSRPDLEAMIGRALD